MCITAECPDPTEVGIWWRDDASWKLYSSHSMRAILEALLTRIPSLRIELPPIKSSAARARDVVPYLIDLSKMEQTNLVSGHKRAIKLILPASSPRPGNKFICRNDQKPHDSKPGHGDPAMPSAARFRLHNSSLLVIRRGNIAEWKVDGKIDAVVYPCGTPQRSTQLQDSPRGDPSTVAVALHRAAGPKLQEALQKGVHFGSGRGRCGDAVITPGFDLPAAHVVHTFGTPVYKKHAEESSCAKLERTYKSALSLAALNGMRYMAFPAISCGGGGFPVELAARVAMEAICGSSNNGGVDMVLEIHFVLMKEEVMLEWMAQANKIFSCTP